jgi:predicted transcriptional regulator
MHLQGSNILTQQHKNRSFNYKIAQYNYKNLLFSIIPRYFGSMKPLTRKEQEILETLYRIEKGFVKDVIAALPDENKPAYNTVSTLIRRLENKGYVGYEEFGSTYRYYPLVPAKEYQQQGLSKIVDTFFGSSYKSVVAHFAKEQKLSKQDLEEIMKMIEEE